MYVGSSTKVPGMRGNTLASTTRRFAVPSTRKEESSTAPMGQLQEAWCPHASCCRNASSAGPVTAAPGHTSVSSSKRKPKNVSELLIESLTNWTA